MNAPTKKATHKQSHKHGFPHDAPNSPAKIYLVNKGIKSGSGNETTQSGNISEHVGVASPKVTNQTSSETSKSEKSPAHIQAIHDVMQYRAGLITATDLKNRHPQTYKNWDGMKQRCRGDSQTGLSAIALHPTFERFADFLEIMGPRPEPSWSLDKIDYAGSYTPDNVRWASKTTQSRNRRNTVYLKYRGKTLPLAEWAEELGISAPTLRGRKRAGWTDEEAIEGKRSWDSNSHSSPTTSDKIWEYTPWPYKYREQLEHRYQCYGGCGEHRIRFMHRYSQKMIANIQEKSELYPWSDDYIPSDLELQEMESLNHQHDIWLSIYHDSLLKSSEQYKTRRFRKYYLPDWVEEKLYAYAKPPVKAGPAPKT